MQVNEARLLTRELVSPLGIEWVGVEQALGRVLAQTMTARYDLPGECRSRFDGYAVLSSDTLGASSQHPVCLEMRPGLAAAGHWLEQGPGPGESVRILTGAPVPHAADAVVPQEEAVRDGERLMLQRPYAASEGTVAQGEETQRGDLLLRAGQLLTPTLLALAVGQGLAVLPVYRRPRVALLATGDEVRELGEMLEGPWTFCNNRHLLGWLVKLQGAVVLHLGVARDDPAVIEERLAKVEAEMIISTGGMGKGDRDYVLQSWKRLGVELRFDHLNLLPGKNSAMGTRGRQIFFGFPGAPWTAQILFEELAAPMLWGYQGMGGQDAPVINAVLERSVSKKKGFHKAVQGTLDMRTTPPCFRPVAGKPGLSASIMCNGFAYTILDADVSEAVADSKVRVRFHSFPLLAFSLFGGGGSC